MDANLGTALFEITIFLLGLYGVCWAKRMHNKIVNVEAEKFAYTLVGMLGIFLIFIRYFI